MKERMKAIPAHYDNLDAPIYIWEKIHFTNDLSWLLIKREKVNAQMLAALEKIWENIYDQYLAEFGFSETFIEIKKKEIEIAKLKLDLIITGDRINKTFIKVAENELDEMKKEIGKSDFMATKINIETRLKFQVNMMTTSIREFYSYIKHLK